MRRTADRLRQSSVAGERVDQWVALRGVRSRVVAITASTWASVTVRGRPTRGSSHLADEASSKWDVIRRPRGLSRAG
jgi:hypothetical protein